jgi:hypothetical protein
VIISRPTSIIASVAIRVELFQDEDGRNTEHGIKKRRK